MSPIIAYHWGADAEIRENSEGVGCKGSTTSIRTFDHFDFASKTLEALE